MGVKPGPEERGASALPLLEPDLFHVTGKCWECVKRIALLDHLSDCGIYICNTIYRRMGYSYNI